MAKKLGFNPFVVLTAPPVPTDVIVIGGGTGEGGSHEVPMSFHDWLNSAWAEDFIMNDIIDEDDYAIWWENCGFSKEDWEDLNPDLDWDDYFG